MVEEPALFPTTTAQREPGPARTPWRKPSRRSSITEMVAKMAENSSTIVTTPGKKNAR